MEQGAVIENSLCQSSKCIKTNKTKFILSSTNKVERTKTQCNHKELMKCKTFKGGKVMSHMERNRNAQFQCLNSFIVFQQENDHFGGFNR